MSQQTHSSSKKTPTAIKIAAKDASQRNSGGNDAADPGPGDPNAAPSVAPQLVDIPEPPTPSELVVKSGTSKNPSAIASTNEASSQPRFSAGQASGTGPKSIIMASMPNSGSRHSKQGEPSVQGSQVGPAASNPSQPNAREPTSSRPLTGPSGSTVTMGAGPKSSLGSAKATSASPSASGAGSPRVSASGTGGGGGAGAPATASSAMQADSGLVHDEDEEGEGEMEQPDEGTPPATSPMSSRPPSGMSSGGVPSSAKSIDGVKAPPSSGGGLSKASTHTAGRSPATSSADEGASDFGSKKHGDKKKKKVTKFRYHKRITVRTSGKTSPSAVMDKVNKKDHNAALTPSTIEDLDPQELMRRAGIKGNKKTHWRVRLRQTKRLTKNGKTTTQTKVAYRDSEGNKRIKTSSSPFCKHCGKKLEECKCDAVKSEKEE